MPSIVNASIQGNSDMVSAIKNLQTFLARPVSVGIDNQAIRSEIVKLQTYLSTVAASTPSGFKYDPTKINRSIDDQALAASIIGLQTAANLS
jgi:hypothetical protein